MTREEILTQMGISPEVFAFCEKQEEGLTEKFKEIDRIAEANQWTVLEAF